MSLTNLAIRERKRKSLNIALLLLLYVVLSILIMRTVLISVGFFEAALLSLLPNEGHSSGSDQLSGPEVVTAASGGYVTISCQYDQRFRGNRKYWCKGLYYDLCHKVVETPGNRLNNRSSISDDKMAGVITVTMHSLSKRDEDMYWCVIARFGRDIYTGVRLHISQTALTLTTSPSSSLEQDELSWWWMALRWILLVLMLCSLVITHVTVWKIKAAKKRSQQQQHHHENLKHL